MFILHDSKKIKYIGLETLAIIIFASFCIGYIQAQLVEYTLTTVTDGTGSGTVDLSPPGGSYTSGTVVTVTANPAAGSSFTSWSGDLSGSTNPASITMDGNRSVTATFTLTSGTTPPPPPLPTPPQNYTITLKSMDLKDNHINLGELLLDGQHYEPLSTATMVEGNYALSYNSEPNYLFDHWETLGDITVNNPLSSSTNLIVTGNGTIMAIYTPIIFEVSLGSREENGTSTNLGSYIVEGVNINRNDTFKREAGNYIVTFKETIGYVFYGWEVEGGVAVNDTMKNPALISIHGNGSLTAIYLIPRGRIKIVVKGPDGSKISNASVSTTLSPKQQSQLVALTDSDGSTVFGDVIIGRYDINVRKVGYIAKTLTIWPKIDMLVTGTFVLVKQNYTLTIQILDQSENPLGGVSVVLTGGPIGQQTLVNSTNSFGLTTFTGIYLGQYNLLAANKGFEPQSANLEVKHNEDNKYIFKLAETQDNAPIITEDKPEFPHSIIIGAAIVIASSFLILIWYFRGTLLIKT